MKESHTFQRLAPADHLAEDGLRARHTEDAVTFEAVDHLLRVDRRSALHHDLPNRLAHGGTVPCGESAVHSEAFLSSQVYGQEHRS